MPSTPQDHKKSSKKKQKSSAVRPTPIPTASDPNDKYAPNAWASGGVGGMEDLVVPSGQLCLVRRPGLEGLVKAGVIRNMDSLTAIVQKEHIDRVEGKPGQVSEVVDAQSILDDPKALDDIMYIVDRVVCHVVVKPEIHLAPNDVTRKVPGVIYTDMVDLMDKMFIFNFVVGGTRDIESFREGSGAAVGGLEGLEAVPGSSQ